MSGLPRALPHAIRAGRLLGCMSCDIGGLNRIAVLSAYSDLVSLHADRAATLGASDPYGVSTYLNGIDTAAFTKLSVAADIEPHGFGPYYEIRTYEIAAKGRAETAAAWSNAFEKRNALSTLLMVMASVDTLPTRMVQIWPYASLAERAQIRAEASKLGIWPPPGGSDHVLSLRSEVFVPLPISPLQ